MAFPIRTRPPEKFEPALASEIARVTREAVPSPTPFFVRMLGVPGAGKSTLSAQIAHALQERSPVVIGFDRWLEVIPAYIADPNRDTAALRFRDVAQAACHTSVKRLIEKKANVIFDNGGWLKEHVKMLEYARQQGYQITVVHVTAGPDLAKLRVKLRGLKDGRCTPPEFIDERAKAIPLLVESYRSIAQTFFQVLNNHNNDPGRLRLEKKGAKIASTVAGGPFRTYRPPSGQPILEAHS